MIALPDVARETYPTTICFPVAKQEISDTEARLLRLVANAETRLRIAATNAIIAARDKPGTLAELSVLLEQGRIEEAIQKLPDELGRSALRTNTQRSTR